MKNLYKASFFENENNFWFTQFKIKLKKDNECVLKWGTGIQYSWLVSHRRSQGIYNIKTYFTWLDVSIASLGEGDSPCFFGPGTVHTKEHHTHLESITKYNQPSNKKSNQKQQMTIKYPSVWVDSDRETCVRKKVSLTPLWFRHKLLKIQSK